MRKLVFIVLGIIMVSILFALFSKKEDTEGRIKKRLDTTTTQTYRFEEEVCQVDYPSCFHVKSKDSSVVRFIMEDENDHVRIGLTCFIEPNVEGWNVNEAVDSVLSDNRHFTFKYVGSNYYVLYEDIPDNGMCSFEKTYLIANKWYSYTLYYQKTLEKQVERLMELVLAWHPGSIPQDEKENKAVLVEWKHQLDMQR